ncbi:MAG: FecR domain-containing protein, partial [Chthoniobacterales bacterium]|nr:FecR domain-containing protein [Chthoniobacterales bacterium]
MKEYFASVSQVRYRILFGIFSSLLIFAAPAPGTELKEARMTAVIKEVNLLPGQAAPRPAAVNDTVRQGDAVRTGVESRSELTFADLTLARLGANTIFNFDQGSRTIELGGGAILLRVPKGSGGAQIKTSAVTAAITGTTVMVEYSAKSTFKFIVLEGSAELTLNGSGDSVVVNAGECSVTDLDPPPTQLGRPVEIDIGRLMETSQLIQDFPPLESLGLIGQQVQAQEEAKANGELTEGSAASNGVQPLAMLTDLTDVVSQRVDADPNPLSSPSPSASPSPSPGPSASPSPSPSPRPSASPSPSPTPRPSPSPSASPTPRPSPSPSASPSPSPSPRPSVSPSPS